jgi:hypothetical protein
MVIWNSFIKSYKIKGTYIMIVVMSILLFLTYVAFALSLIEDFI